MKVAKQYRPFNKRTKALWEKLEDDGIVQKFVEKYEQMLIGTREEVFNL